jgi:uncharacterized protein YsxB (DUF464 family)
MTVANCALSIYLRIDIDEDIRENEVSERANLLIKGHRFSLNNVAKSYETIRPS